MRIAALTRYCHTWCKSDAWENPLTISMVAKEQSVDKCLHGSTENTLQDIDGTRKTLYLQFSWSRKQKLRKCTDKLDSCEETIRHDRQVTQARCKTSLERGKTFISSFPRVYDKNSANALKFIACMSSHCMIHLFSMQIWKIITRSTGIAYLYY